MSHIPCAQSKAASATRAGPRKGISTQPPLVAMPLLPLLCIQGRRNPSPGPVATRRQVRTFSSPVAIPAAVCPLVKSEWE